MVLQANVVLSWIPPQINAHVGRGIHQVGIHQVGITSGLGLSDHTKLKCMDSGEYVELSLQNRGKR